MLFTVSVAEHTKKNEEIGRAAQAAGEQSRPQASCLWRVGAPHACVILHSRPNSTIIFKTPRAWVSQTWALSSILQPI